VSDVRGRPQCEATSHGTDNLGQATSSVRSHFPEMNAAARPRALSTFSPDLARALVARTVWPGVAAALLGLVDHEDLFGREQEPTAL
jgi:hypothetical protein